MNSDEKGADEKRLGERFRTLLEELKAGLSPSDLERVLEIWRLDLEALRRQVFESGGEDRPLPQRFGIIGESPAMQKVFESLEKIIPANYPVLVTGQSGTGKELIAKALHQYGPRKHETFLSENCAAIPETLLESILFGHKKGAFTGAHRDNPGHFVAADKGTLFLDEIGDMPLSMQSKLLRVIQDGEVRAVGGDRPRKVDVRLVAATNRDLEARVREGKFREDLFYRLNVLDIHLPPLRERGEDVLLIAEHFLRQARKALGRPFKLSEKTRKEFLAAPWPGNIRELENTIRRLSALATGDEL
ncbi:MAG TPA: sigma-54-dependent Fis family transcriptional regulator [Planctomycetes bacterium]|nr:sigma-54-dependent Fis family transcriptional regulator [Planctomycetota bacterium]